MMCSHVTMQNATRWAVSVLWAEASRCKPVVASCTVARLARIVRLSYGSSTPQQLTADPKDPAISHRLPPLQLASA